MPNRPPQSISPTESSVKAPRKGAAPLNPFLSSSEGYFASRPPMPRRSLVKHMDHRLAFGLSVLTHVASPVVLFVMTLLVMMIFGLSWEDLFHKVQPTPRDLEFVLVPPDALKQKPLDPNTHYRARQTMRAGGQHRPDQAVHLDKPAPAKPPAPVLTEQPPAPQTAPQPKTVAVQRAINAPLSQKRPQPAHAGSQTGLPTPETTLTNDSSPNGSFSNPQGGNKNAPDGVDALQVPDFGPYMKDLETRIKQTWQPPRGNESKHVVVQMRVRCDGSLETAEIAKTSGAPIADQAALTAIHEVFPFRPLPNQCAEEAIDIQFNFDYKIFGDKQRLNRRIDNG